MRLITLFLVLGLLVIGAAAYANGAAPREEAPPMPAEEAAPMPEAAPPVGAGPAPPTAAPPAMAPIITEVETFNTNLAVSTFGVDRSSVMSLRQSGWSWGDIHLMSNIADRANRPLLEIAGLRSQGFSYMDIASRYNLSSTDILSPMPVRARVAGYVAEYGYQPIYYRTDPWGNPVLTRYEAERLSRLGYNWQDIAIAANIAAETGANVREILSWIDRGYTWQQVAREYGLDPEDVMDVSRYPFAREPGAPAPVFAPAAMPPAGAGPMPQPSAPPPTY